MQRSIADVCQGINTAHCDRAWSEWDAACWEALRRLQLRLLKNAGKPSCPADSMHVQSGLHTQHETTHCAVLKCSADLLG